MRNFAFFQRHNTLLVAHYLQALHVAHSRQAAPTRWHSKLGWGCLWSRCVLTFYTDVSLALIFSLLVLMSFVFCAFLHTFIRLILPALPLYVFMYVLSFIFDALQSAFFGIDLHWPNLQITQVLNFYCDSQPVVLFSLRPPC